MTIDTTHAESTLASRHKRRLWPWAVSLVVNGALLAALAMFATSTFLFDKGAEQERTQQIKDNQQALIERLRDKQERTRLPKDKARELEEQVLNRRKREARQIVDRLAEGRRVFIEEREGAFDRLDERTPRKHAERALAPLLATAENLAQRVEPFLNNPAVPEGEKQKVRAAVERVEQTAQEIRDADPADVRKLVRQLFDEAFPVADTGYQFPARHPDATAGDARGQAKALQDAGDGLRAHALGMLDNTLAADPTAVNDTAAAKGDATIPHAFADATPPDTSAMSLDELYDTGVALEKNLQALSDDAAAADAAVSQNDAYGKVREGVGDPVRPGGAPERPTLAEIAPGGVETVADLARTRQAADEAVRELRSIETRQLANANPSVAKTVRQSQAQGGSRTLDAAVANAGYSDLTTMTWGGTASGDSPQVWQRVAQPGEVKLPEALVYANALPGRRITDATDRSGWLYLDTWYVIGPWKNHGKLTMSEELPPQQAIDLDANYDNDQTYGPLRWQFLQSNEILITPPNVRESATYFAYTEIYSDADREVVVAIAADDAAKFWLNGEPIYDMKGASVYALGEALRKVKLKRGTNTLLGRIENGPIHCLYSVMLCPPQAVPEPDTADDLAAPLKP